MLRHEVFLPAAVAASLTLVLRLHANRRIATWLRCRRFGPRALIAALPRLVLLWLSFATFGLLFSGLVFEVWEQAWQWRFPGRDLGTPGAALTVVMCVLLTWLVDGWASRAIERADAEEERALSFLDGSRAANGPAAGDGNGAASTAGPTPIQRLTQARDAVVRLGREFVAGQWRAVRSHFSEAERESIEQQRHRFDERIIRGCFELNRVGIVRRLARIAAPRSSAPFLGAAVIVGKPTLQLEYLIEALGCGASVSELESCQRAWSNRRAPAAGESAAAPRRLRRLDGWVARELVEERDSTLLEALAHRTSTGDREARATLEERFSHSKREAEQEALARLRDWDPRPMNGREG
jgi:hypothetical protein